MKRITEAARRRWDALLVLIGLASGFVFLRALFPFLLTRLVNLALRRSPYRGRVTDVRVSPLRGTVAASGIDLVPAEPGATLPSAHVDRAAFKVYWKELWKGGLVMSFDVERPVVLVRAPTKAEDRDGGKKPSKPDTAPPAASRAAEKWNRKARRLFPIAFHHVSIQNGAVHIKDVPGQDGTDLRLNDLNLVAERISNSERYSPDLRAEIHGSARAMSSGQIRLDVDAYPLADQPTFNADFELRGLDLREIADFLREAAAADVKSGRIDLVAEAAAADGHLVGYAKPIVDDLQIARAAEASKADSVRFAALRAATNVLRNKERDQIAARVDFSGRLDDPSVGVVPAVKSVLKNAFSNALSPSLEGTVELPTARPKSVATRPGTEGNRPLTKQSWFKMAFTMLKDAVSRWSDDDAPRLGASLSYYTAFSLAPLLLLAISLAGLIFGRDAVQGRVMDQLGGMMGADSAHAIQSMIQAAYKPASGTVAAVVGFISLLVGASGVMTELKNALNVIWRVKGKEGFGALVKDRLLSFGMVLAIGFLLLVSLALSAGVAAVSAYFKNLLPIPGFVLELINALVSFGVVLLMFATLFKGLPDAKIKWHDVWIGAAITALLFTIGKSLIGLYIGKGAVGSSYGAAGSVLVMLLWIYYSAQILYFGAEFTKLYADRFGSGVKPSQANLTEKLTY